MSNLDDVPVNEETQNIPLFNTVNMLDSRLVTKNQLTYAVNKSGAQVTQYAAAFSSANTNSMSCNVIVPSLSTLISRAIKISSILTFEVVTHQEAGAAMPCVFGLNACLAPFALHQLFNNMSLTVNNYTFNFDCAENLDMVIKMLDEEKLKKFCDYTPSMQDQYQNYEDIATYYGSSVADNVDYSKQPANSPFGDYANKFASDYPRGSYEIVNILRKSSINGDNTYNYNDAGVYYMPQTPAGYAPATADRDITTTIVVRVTEPLIMSPLILQAAGGSNDQAIYGIQSLSLVATCNALQPRSLRFMDDGLNTFTSCTLKSVSQSDTKLLLTYLTAHPSMRLSARNLVSNIHLQTFTTPIVMGNNPNQGWDSTKGVLNAITTIDSSSFQLSSIPDSVFIAVRPRAQYRTANVPDIYLPITSLSITFSNQAGLLSTASTHDLYEMTKENGLNTNWDCFKGYAYKGAVYNAPYANYTAGASGPIQQKAGGCQSVEGYIPTSGSPVKLSFAKDIPLSQDYAAPGLIGVYSFQVKVNIADNTGLATGTGITTEAQNYELVLMFENSGIVINSVGTTSVFTGILSKQDVLTAAEKEPYQMQNYKRLYGSGWASTITDALSKVVMDRLKNNGSGQSAGGMSGGGKMKNRTY